MSKPLRALKRATKAHRYNISRRVLPRYGPKKYRQVPKLSDWVCTCGGGHRPDDFDWCDLTSPIYFTYRFGTEWLAAVQLRAFQVASLLNQLTPPNPVVVQPLENLVRAKPRDSIIIVQRTGVRPLSGEMLNQLRSDGNIIVFDMVDGEVAPSVERLAHAYLCSSVSEARAREKASMTTIVSLMSPDQRCPIADFGGKDFRIGYHGLTKNARHLESLPEITAVAYREEAPQPGELPMPMDLDVMGTFSHHYSVRSWNPGDGFKPLMKAFVAARLGACFIGSKEDAETTLVMAPHYPYLAESSELGDVKRVMNYARETFGGPVWQTAVEEMRRLRQVSCPFSTAQELVAGLSQLRRTRGPTIQSAGECA